MHLSIRIFFLILGLCSFVYSQGDLCTSPIQISSIPFSYSGTTSGVGNEQTCSQSFSAGDLWFRFSPTTSTFADVGTCSSSSYDSYIFIVSGTCASYNCLRADDDTCNSNSQALVLGFEFQAGNTYYIIVTGFAAAEGAFTLSVTPVTSGCTSAQTITSLPFTVAGSLSSSSRAVPCVLGSYSQWYTYTPPADVRVQLSTCSSASFDTVIYVASGTCPMGLSCLASNDDANPACAIATASTLPVTLSNNIQYYFVVASLDNYILQPSGTYSLSVTILPPANDICSGATEITSLPFSTIALIDAANMDFSCVTGTLTLPSTSVDVWYSFTPLFSYPNVAISTCGSSVRSFLYLATGSCGSRLCLQLDSSSCPYGTATGYIQTPLPAGNTYYIAVAPLLPTGTFQLEMTVAPSNDQCYGAFRISSLPYSYTGDTANAKWDFTCPLSVRQGRDIYFYFTPPVDYSSVNIDLCGSNYDTYVYIASGNCNSLTCLGFNDNGPSCSLSQSYLSYPALTTGTTYYIIVTGNCVNGPSCYGSVSLTITGIAAHSCYGPTVVGSLPYSYSGTTTSAPGDFACTSGDTPVVAVTGNHWFVLTPTVTYYDVFIDVCSASFNAALFLVTGACDDLQCSSLSTGDSEYCTAINERGTLIADATLQAGISYYFVVTGLSPADYGSFTLTISIDTSSFVSILAPVAGSVLGGPQLHHIQISGSSGTYDVLSIVTLTISSSTNIMIAEATVNFDSSWSAIVDLTSMSDGSIVVDADLADPRGNLATTSITYTKDATTFVFISAPEPGSFVNEVTSTSVVIQGSGEVGGSVVVTLSDSNTSTTNIVSSPVTVAPDGTWSMTVDIAGLSDGSIRIMATITDTLGNVRDSPSVTITKDTSLSLSILVPSNYQYIVSEARAPYLTVSGFADVGASVFVVISDGTVLSQDVVSKIVTATPVGTWSVTVDISTLNDGNIFIVASAVDEANNVVSSQTVALAKDTIVFPATIISSPVDGDTVSGSQVSALVVSGTGEPSGQISLRLYGTAGIINRTINVPAAGFWSTTVNISSLPNGPITIGGLTADEAGNTAPIPSVVVTKM